MRLTRSLIFFGLIGLGLSLTATDARAAGLEVLVAADAIVSLESTRPAPGKPVYLFPQLSLSLGESFAGFRLPDPTWVEQAIVAQLAKSGFIRTQVGGPMLSLLILATSGADNFAAPADSYDLAFYRPLILPRMLRHIAEDQVGGSFYRREDGTIVADTDMSREEDSLALDYNYRASRRSRDQAKVETIMGTKTMFLANLQSSAIGRKIATASNEDRLYITLSAFDAVLVARKQKHLLWRTSMSVNWKNDLAVSLPVMLAIGRPFLGTDVKTPAFMDDRERRNFGVDIGETNVIPSSSGIPVRRSHGS